jgi:phosphonatase-like hydrolase
MKEIDLVIFDLAGTTVKDRGQVANAFTSALAEQGIEVTPEQLSRVRGSSKRQAVLQFIPDMPDRARRAETVYNTFCEHLARRYRLEGVEPIDGAERMFRWLRERDVSVALNTGFDRDMTALLLGALGWANGVADAVVCGDDVREGRPAPYMIFRAMEAAGALSVRRIANVGDTTLDLHAGDNAHARWNVGVLTGAHDRHRLKSAPHTHLVSSVAELPDLFEGLC